jgi:16S rRNA (cytosine967-C5)-methyltransferase
MADRKAPASLPPSSPGLATRRAAVEIVSGVLRQKRPLDDLLERGEISALPERDRALVRTIVATVLRRLGTLRHMLGMRLERGLPKSAPNVEDILLIGAAQILFLDVPDHASVDLSVRLAQADIHASHYSGLVNAVLRKACARRQDRARRAGHRAARYARMADAALDRALRRATARAIAVAHTQEPALDLTVKSDPAKWAAALDGRVLDTGTVRAVASGPVPQLPGYDDGAWWVQDAAAALPREAARRHPRQIRRRSLRRARRQDRATGAGRRAGHRRRSLGAAPRARPDRNLLRLQLSAEVIRADAAEWRAAQFDAVLGGRALLIDRHDPAASPTSRGSSPRSI